MSTSKPVSKLSSIRVTEIMRHAVIFKEQTSDTQTKETASNLADFADEVLKLREVIKAAYRSDTPADTLIANLKKKLETHVPGFQVTDWN